MSGSHITVRYVQWQVEKRGLRSETVADNHGLDLADASAALTSSHANPEEMERVEERRSRLADEAAERTTPSPPDE